MVEVLFAIVSSLLGLALGPATRFVEDRKAKTYRKSKASTETVREGNVVYRAGGEAREPQPTPQGPRVLAGLLIVVVLLGALTLKANWSYVRSHGEDLLFFAWLFLTMMLGMFAQVISRNRQAGQSFFQVQAADLLYPLLFSVIVFYPIWSVAASAPRTFFAFYAAFLNGFFWETVVAAAKPVTASVKSMD